MDSLTQIVLGAAVGEAVLGRKIGNRAMIWGGIAGTIPDLDVFANMATDPISSLAYHRAFTHSLAFGLLAPFILSMATYRLYGGRDGPLSKTPPWVAWPILSLAFFVLLYVGSAMMPIEVLEIPKIAAVITIVVAMIYAAFGLREYFRQQPKEDGNATIGGWWLLFFAAIITHPLLDCFTAYGTQFLEPFSSHRTAWNTISVADPLYTLPFLLLLVLAARRLKGSRARKRLNIAGLIVSSAYLLLTIINYFNVDAVMESTIKADNIPASRHVISPSILNNVLWSGTVQGQTDDYYFSRYSILDSQRRFEPFKSIQGRHTVLKNYQDTRELKILEWFTKGYISFIPLGEGKVQVNDLRFGLLGDDPDDPNQYVFHWVIDTTTNPITVQQEAGPSEDVDMNDMFSSLWERLLGK